MGKTLKSRLVAYQANGSKLGLLPEPTSYTVSFTHDAVGALTVSYSRKALRGEILDRRLETGLEIAVEVSDGGRWIEPYNGRFVIASRSRNALDVSNTVSLTGVSYGWLLKKALNLDTSRLETKGDEKGTRKFANANAGTIMRTFMDENWNRGGVKVDCSRFTSGADSAGKQWGYMLPSIYYDLGISMQDVLDSLVNNGLCDWRTDARQLLLWNADSVAICRDLSKSCVVTLAQDVSEAPDDESIDGLASSILVRGDNINFRQDNPNAPKPWGGWELYSSQQGVNKKETAEQLIKPTLANAARVRGQYTRSVNVVEASCLPLVDYTIGDWITAPTVANREKVRVQQVTLQLDSTGFKASLILNDKNYDSSVRLTKRMNGITGGAHLGGASGAIPAPEKDHRVPKAPQNLSANSDAYINVNGYARGMVTARWDDVTLATDGTAMDITSYVVEYRVNKTGYEWHSAGTTTEHTLSWSNLDCGVQILIRVRAVPSYSDQMGEWSSVFALTVAKDTTPPPVPSKPILSSEFGVVSVNWDGKTADGGSMPIDWDRNILGERLTNGSFKEIAAVSTGIGDYVITGLTAGTITSDRIAAGQFRGYVFTGAVFQSSEAENTGMKLNSTALQMWDSAHNQTVYLDGKGKSNLLTGTFQTRISGHRVRISPDFRTHTIGGAETFDGDGLEFPAYKGSTAYFVSPTIVSQISSNQVGEMGGMALWSGRIAQHDPGSYLRLRSMPRQRGGTGSGGVTSHVSAVADTDYDEPDIGKKSRALLNLTGDANAGSSVWLEAEDGNGSVGVGANIGTGYVYLGGYLGGITNRFTFQAQAAWKAWYPNSGSKIAAGAAMQVNCTFSPTKYGHYYVVANADSQWAGIIAHPCNTGGQSGFQLKLYNADQPCPVDVYAEFLAYLVK